MEMFEDQDLSSYKSIPFQSRKPPKKPKKQSIEAIQVTIQKKKQCNAKALDVVTRFSEGTVSEVCLIDHLQYINQEHYQDIVEERAINQFCGYPLCSSQLKNIPSKKYHISTSHNKVFDITDRKNFCSNLCYKASKFLKDQVSTSPLWLRDGTSSDGYKLISLHAKGGTVGDEVDIGFTPLKVGADDLLSHNITTNSSETIENNELISCDTEEVAVGNQTVTETCLFDSTSSSRSSNVNTATLQEGVEQSCTGDKTALLDNISNLHQTYDKMCFNEQLIENKNPSESQMKCENIDERIYVSVDITKLNQATSELHNKILEKCKEDIKKERKIKAKNKKSDLKNEGNKSSPMQVIIIKIEQILREWFSLDSLCFIVGEEKLKDILEEKTNRNVSELNNVFSRTMDRHMYERYLAICKRLNVLELEDTKLDLTYKEDAKRPLPDYEVLKEEAKEMDLKVKMFYKGDKLVQFEEHEGASCSKTDSSNQEPVLPLVDLHAQKALRRRIVIDKFKKVLQDLQKSLRLKSFNLFEQIQALVSTFDLSAHNITMRPAEWNLVTIITIKLLSLRDKTLEQALASNPTNKYLTLLLMSYSVDNGYLDRLIVWLTDIESVLQKKS